MIKIKYEDYKKAINSRLDDLLGPESTKIITPHNLRTICLNLAVEFIDMEPAKVEVPAALEGDHDFSRAVEASMSQYQRALAYVLAERGYHATIERVRQRRADWNISKIVETCIKAELTLTDDIGIDSMPPAINSFIDNPTIEKFEYLIEEARDLGMILEKAAEESKSHHYDETAFLLMVAYSFASDIISDSVKCSKLLAKFREDVENGLINPISMDASPQSAL